ncbi:interleukin-27 receptor subunit alpha isoform X2 [Saimiri boliviensis]|uniref:interleukin-27 receptor subunit alpha isoform X2 n=1 Tax=Saimiri boliviensis TaxID=27679 RepID=UPI00193E27AE|nr:interleukin-27 receptor subunit alpha isoform X1 [Saimiri boliviensis boliviensis]
MRGGRGAPFRPWPLSKLALLPLLWVLFQRTRPQGSAGPLQCHGVGPFGDLNCSWEPLGDLGAPSKLHLQSQKYGSNKTQTVAVVAGQSWVSIPREQLTTSDKLLVWGTKTDQSLWPPVFVDLETQMKPNAPRLGPDVDFSEDDPLEATVHWTPPTWPSHKVLICQFHYRRCQEVAWTLLEPELKTVPLAPLEIQDLELAASYKVHGRCRMEKQEDFLWGEWSPVLSFQTPPSAPKDVWVSGNLCGTPGGEKPLLLWKPPEPCVQVSYNVWFWVGGRELSLEGITCCNSSIPSGAEWASVSAVNATSWEPLTKLSLVCLDSASAPHSVAVSSIAESTELLVTWQPGPGEPQEHVVDWVGDGDPLEKLNWVRLPPGNLSALLPGNFTVGIPYRITVTTVSASGLASAPPVWGFREELTPLVGPTLWRLQDAPPGTPAIAWGEVPRHQLRGHLTHYTLCSRSGNRPSVCMNVSCDTQSVTLPDLPWGPCELWVMASTIAGQGPPGPILRLHLPDNTLKWKVLPGLLFLWVLFLMGCGLRLATSGRCHHLRHKMLPRWIWEKVPDPANSSSGQPHMESLRPSPLGTSPYWKWRRWSHHRRLWSPPSTPRPLPRLTLGMRSTSCPRPRSWGFWGPSGHRLWPEPHLWLEAASQARGVLMQAAPQSWISPLDG